MQSVEVSRRARGARRDRASILSASATDLARAIREGELRSREVVDVFIARIREVNPILNAVVVDRFAEARAEADELDRRLARGDLAGPFHGVPCSIKETFALRGMPQTGGVVRRKHHVATEDAITVKRMRDAGFVPLGITNTSELAMWLESNNRVYGRTRNPHDPSRIAGGSSGGEGAIVGGMGAPLGLGSDFAGSIRLPAYFNGVFGHKPSTALVPRSGQFPKADGGAARFHVTGPLARHAEDLYPVLSLLAGPDGEDALCEDVALEDPASIDVADLDVIVVEDNGVLVPHPDVRDALARAADALARAGARVRRERFPALAKSFLIWAAMLAEDKGTPFKELLLEGAPTGPAVLKYLLGRSPHTLPALGLAVLEELEEAVGDRLGAGRDENAALGRALQKDLIDAMGSRGVLLYPPYTTPAPRHVRPIFGRFHWTYTAILSVLELPVTQVPVGVTREGIPLGVQVASPPLQDARSLAVAAYLDQALGGSPKPKGTPLKSLK
jgi:fatty acid amide hydrolase 2